jgi:acyl-coenzyme A synthetase/AMP-(fatty) acid ligase
VVDGDRLPPLRHGAETPCAYLPTSGSTGRPRVALRTVGNLLAAARGPVAALSLRAGMREISVTPFHHTGGFDNGLLLPLLAGLTAVLQPVFDPSAFARTIAAERIELVMASPFVYAMLLERGIARQQFASVEMAVSFGAPCSPALVRRCADELGLVVRQLYGSTETGVIAIQSAATPFAPGLAGTPVAGVDVRILGDDGTELPAGHTGVVAIGGPGVIARYRDATDGDANRFRDGLFRSGDLGCFDPQGVLMLRGRSSAMINLSGVKVDPVEIEHAIGEMPAVSDCLVRGVVDGGDTEFVEALVVTRAGHSLTRKALLEHCRQRLAEYKLPRRITFCASLPIDVAGKRRVDGEAAAP